MAHASTIKFIGLAAITKSFSMQAADFMVIVHDGGNNPNQKQISDGGPRAGGDIADPIHKNPAPR